MTDHMKGLLITGGGVLALTPDALFIKLSGLPAEAMFFWRGWLVGLMLLLPLVLVWGRQFLRNVMAIGRPGLLVALCYAVSTACFVAANTHTVAANVLVIVATAPLWSALFSALILREATPPRTWAASIVALVGVVIVGGDGISRQAGLGELFAMGCAIFVSLSFVVIRSARDVNMIPATALGSFLVGIAGCFFYAAPVDATGWQATLLGCVLFIPLAYMGLTIGPRYLTASEVGLFLLLETVIGPLWVWLAIAEAPGRAGLIGGAIILAALIANTVLGLRRVRPASA